jgi:hypothetical protein
MVCFFAIPLRQGFEHHGGRQATTADEDEPHEEAYAEPAAADVLIKQLRAAPGQLELQDRANAVRGWSILDRVAVAAAVLALLALAVVYVAFFGAGP